MESYCGGAFLQPFGKKEIEYNCRFDGADDRNRQEIDPRTRLLLVGVNDTAFINITGVLWRT